MAESGLRFPREYLDFTTWYLRSKKYITKEDNSDFALTASGVDFVEENCTRIPLLRRLLSAGIAPKFRNQSADDTSKVSSRPKTPLTLPIGSEQAEAQSNL